MATTDFDKAMNYFKQLQQLSLLNCSVQSISIFAAELELQLHSMLSPYNKERIAFIISDHHCDELYSVGFKNYLYWQDVIRSDVEVNSLSFDFFNGYAFRLSNKFKQHNIKINKSKILHSIAKLIGLSGSQALKQRDLISPEFLTYKFEEKEQDVIELITYNSVVIDVQISAFEGFAGTFASLGNHDKELKIYRPKQLYFLPDAATSLERLCEVSVMKYPVESVTATNSDYVAGFMDIVDGGVEALSREKYKNNLNYKFGANVAVSNLNRIK